jgi:competence protein ComEC
MKKCLSLFLLFALLTLPVAAQKARTTLEILYVDVEGGAATLIVTPAGESILVDAGWPGAEGRDATRIQAAMKKAGVTEIDHLILTHYHTDHWGGIPELAKRVKINHFYDHGPMTELKEDRNFPTRLAAYQEANKGKSITLKPGDAIKLKQAAGTPPITLQCLASATEVVAKKGMAGKPNPECANASLSAEDPSDNARSVVFLLRYGGFEFLDSGDLTWNIEHKLVCPTNLIGEIDLYQVAHHGTESSNSPAFTRSLNPSVAIMNNGAKKGGHPDSVKRVREAKDLKDLWAIHRNIASSPEQNAAEELTANPEEKDDAGHMIRVSVDAKKREFTVVNDRNGKTKSYPVK